MIDAFIRGNSAVECDEVSFEPLRHVISSSSGMNHRCHELSVDQLMELTWLLQAVETFHLNHRSEHFIGRLISPAVHLGDVDVINEHHQSFSQLRAENISHPLVHISLD